MADINGCENLKMDLSCPVCLGYFTDPVLAKCGHICCRKCFFRGLEEDYTSSACPLCRASIQDGDNLRSDKGLDNLAPIGKLLRSYLLRSIRDLTTCDQHGKEESLFCEEDHRLLCESCLFNTEHREHRVLSLEKAAKQCMQKLQEVWNILRQRQEEFHFKLDLEKYRKVHCKKKSRTAKVLLLCEYETMQEEELRLQRLIQETREKLVQFEESRTILCLHIHNVQALISEADENLEKFFIEVLLVGQSSLGKSEDGHAWAESSPEGLPRGAAQGDPARPTQKKSKLKLNRLKPTTKQPSKLSKFWSLGETMTHSGPKGPGKEADGDHEEDFKGSVQGYLQDDSRDPAPSAGGPGTSVLERSNASGGRCHEPVSAAPASGETEARPGVGRAAADSPLTLRKLAAAAARPSPKHGRLCYQLLQEKAAKHELHFPGPRELAPAAAARRDALLPFVGLSNLGNTCFLNSVLQVLHFCPGFKSGVKHLFEVIMRNKEALKEEPDSKVLARYEFICSLQSSIISVEQLQVDFLLNPEKYTDELTTQPRQLLNVLRELNPMYEGGLQHDAQEVLQCILGNIQEACQLLKKKEELKDAGAAVCPPQGEEEPLPRGDCSGREGAEDGGRTNFEEGLDKVPEANGKRKSDSGAGNAKKKSKLSKDPESCEDNQGQARSNKKATEDAWAESSPEGLPRGAAQGDTARPTQKKSKLKLNRLKPTTKQPSKLSKFWSLGETMTHSGPKGPGKEADGDHEEDFKGAAQGYLQDDSGDPAASGKSSTQDGEAESPRHRGVERDCFELVEKLFQGQLVLRTRCLECESVTEKREDFQDISVPVQEKEFCKVGESSETPPEPKTKLKSLKWAISQFASVERIAGENKYMCETCHHYTEAERSLLFDKMPEVLTVHLKRFAFTGFGPDCYGGGLSKINTSLLTPLELSLEEWSTRPSNDSYGLFAVVMHSGISINSGHYTAFVKVTDLDSLELDKENFVVDQGSEMGRAEPLAEEEAKTLAEEYGDEGSFGISRSAQPGEVLSQKSVQEVGLLRGQKNKPDYDFHRSHKASDPEQGGGEVDESRSPEAAASHSAQGPHRRGEPRRHRKVARGRLEDRVSCAIQSLKEYEGKWLSFNDSEVKVAEEKDFLNSLSPATWSTSTPYLLFYKKIRE